MVKKFYPLELEEWLRTTKELNAREINVLYYIRACDPYSKGLKISASAIALELGVNRSTVSRALKTLERKGYINLEVLSANVILKGNGKLTTLKTANAQDEIISCANLQQAVQNGNEPCKSATSCANLQQATAETYIQTESCDSKIIKIYKTYKDQINDDVCSFSESEVSESVDVNPEDVNRCIEEIRKHLEMDKVKTTITIEEVKTELELVVENQVTEIAVDQLTEVKAEIAVGQPKEELKVKTKLLLQTLNSGEGQNFPPVDVSLKNFIVKTVETKRGIKLTNPDAYVAKCLKKDGDHWRSLYQDSLQPKTKTNEPRMEFWSVEQTLNMAIKNNDLEFAIARFEAYPEYQERVLSNHPDWTEKLTGKRHKTEPQVKVVANTDVISGRLAMLQAKLNLRFLQPQQRLETEAQITVLRDLLGLNRGEMAYASA